MKIEQVSETVIKLSPQELLDKLGYFITQEQYGGIQCLGHGFSSGVITIRLMNYKSEGLHEGEGLDV